MKVLEWEDEEHSAKIVYDLCGDRVGSHFMETVSLKYYRRGGHYITLH